MVLWACANVRWEEVRSALGGARLMPWLPLGVGFYLLGHVVRGVRCRFIVAEEAQLSIVEASNIVVVGYAVNNMLPARAGEVVRIGVLARRTGIPLSQSLAVTFLERVLDGLAILFALAVAVVTLGREGLVGSSAYAISVLFGAALVFVAIATWRPPWVIRVFSRVGGRWGERWHDRSVRFAVSLTRGMARLRRPGDALVIVALSVLVWLLEAGLFVMLLPAFGLPLDLRWGLLAMAVTNLGILMPSTPGFIGTFELFCKGSLVALGVAGSTALGYALVVHLAFFLPITVWGALVLAHYGVEIGSTRALARKATSARRLVPRDLESRDRPDLRPSPPLPGRDPEPGRLLATILEAMLPIEDFGDTARTASDVPGNSPVADCHPLAVEVGRFVNGQIRILPNRLRVMYEAGMLFFRITVRLRYGASFCSLPIARRRAVIEWWAYGPFELGRSLMRPIRATGLLKFYELPEVEEALGVNEETALRHAP